MISIETYVLSAKYTNKKILDVEQVAIDEAVTEAVAQSKLYTDEAISGLVSFNIEIVSNLPENPSTHTIYLVPKSFSSDNNTYYEYIFVNNKWEIIGDTEVDLNNYYTKAEINELIEANKYVLPVATSEVLGGIKVDDRSLEIDGSGTISVNREDTIDVINETITPIDNDTINSLFS